MHYKNLFLSHVTFKLLLKNNNWCTDPLNWNFIFWKIKLAPVTKLVNYRLNQKCMSTIYKYCNKCRFFKCYSLQLDSKCQTSSDSYSRGVTQNYINPSYCTFLYCSIFSYGKNCFWNNFAPKMTYRCFNNADIYVTSFCQNNQGADSHFITCLITTWKWAQT